ncbi:MAG: hypothetical protein H7333_08490 [Bdellovibrionales bacterium]|nr:hypothetical protein [Oligoflexia bacterium]
MIWGEIVNTVRRLNFDFLNEFSIDPRVCLKEMSLRSDDFPYPEQVDDFDEWNEFIPSPELEDILPLHPVERILVEGPLLPIQKVNFHSKSDVDVLYAAILSLQKEWCEKLFISSPERLLFFEKSCISNALKTSTRLGFLKLNILP